MKLIPTQSNAAISGMPGALLREAFLLSDLFQTGAASLIWWETDRAIVGGVCPVDTTVALDAPPGMRSAFFCERREIGLVNLGGPGVVTCSDAEYPLDALDALYLGRGTREITFRSSDAAKPARFYLLSYPAHVAHPPRHVAFSSVPGARLGARASANERTLHKLIHPGAFPTCQVVMGITRMHDGSVWNSMPPHTHLRRSEIYLYFDLPAGQAVFHFMGEPQATRHLVVRDGEAVLSPPWSIHCGAGTAAYSFVWGMGGENQEFADMDPAPVGDLR